MTQDPRPVGAALVLGAALVNVPYALLVARFDYPDILRAPPIEVLERFHDGGPALVGLWLLFAWAGAPLLFALPNLPTALFGERPPALATFSAAVGVAGLVAQMVGLLRWVFVVPLLARVVADPAATEAERAAALVAFDVVHAFGGVLLGEHVGQAFSILWMAALSVALLQARVLPRWLPIFGLAASAMYALAQGELFATVIVGFPAWGPAGLVGSLAWLAFLALLGTSLLRRSARVAASDR